jgi:septal ring factor EnvC (AmiA/AmiB activator)
MLKTIFTGLCLFVLLTQNLHAQSNSAKLRREQATIQKEIDVLRQALKSTRILLQQNIAGLQSARKGKKVILLKQQREKDALIKKLKSREKQLLRELAEKTKADKQLKEDMDNALTHNTVASPDNNAAAGLIFEKNRGKLPWPVENGTVKLHYGRYKVRDLNIYGNNPGITLETAPNADVKNVFDGTVYAIFDMEGNNAVMIAHGKHFITYSNLASVNVVKGQKVTAGEILGTAGINKEEKGEIEFILMVLKENIDPEPWLRKQ